MVDALYIGLRLSLMMTNTIIEITIKPQLPFTRPISNVASLLTLLHIALCTQIVRNMSRDAEGIAADCMQTELYKCVWVYMYVARDYIQ